MNRDQLLNDFAIRSFRDTADADYIAARAAYRSRLVPQFLWLSLQTIEKYFKCILILNRVDSKGVNHRLEKGLKRIRSSHQIFLKLTNATEEFIRHLDEYGRWRYFEMSWYTFGGELIDLDRAVWELRRYCTVDGFGFLKGIINGSWDRNVDLRQIELREGFPPDKYYLADGIIEKIVKDEAHPARGVLLWQNGFFGFRVRRKVRLPRRFHASNAPLFLHPEILDEVQNYVYVPNDVKDAYRRLRRQGEKAKSS